MSTFSDILLHCCCGPCTTVTVDFLRFNGYRVRPVFINPNIKPSEEYEKRLDAFLMVCVEKELDPIIIEDESFTPKSDTGRCSHCFSFRLEAVASKAKELGFPCFTTSLLISPYQKHELLKSIGSSFESFVYFDLRPFFDRSKTQSKELGIYRQKYCGCLQSKVEAKWISKRLDESKKAKLGPVSDWKPDWLDGS